MLSWGTNDEFSLERYNDIMSCESKLDYFEFEFVILMFLNFAFGKGGK